MKTAICCSPNPGPLAFLPVPYILWKRNILTTFVAELKLRQIDDEVWMVVKGNCQTLGWDFTRVKECDGVKAPAPSKLFGHLGKNWSLSYGVWRSRGSPVPHTEGGAVCDGGFAPSGPPGTLLIACFLCGLEFIRQHNVVINTPHFISGENRWFLILRPSYFYQVLFDMEKKIIQIAPQSIIWHSWVLLFFRIHHFSDCRKVIRYVYYGYYTAGRPASHS